jgi:hypothetical protein
MSSKVFELREDFANYSKKCDLDEKIPSNFYPFYLGSSFNWMNLYVSSMHKFYAQYRNKYYSEEEFASAYKRLFPNIEKEKNSISAKKVFKEPIEPKNAESKITSTSPSEIEIVLKKDKTPLFNTIYPKKIVLFTPSKNDSIEGFDIKGLMSKKRVRVKKPRKRLDYDDDTRKKIKRNFFNKALIEALNILLKKSNYFVKFPQNFVANVTKDANKKFLNLSLKEIIESKEIYVHDNLNKYKHNMKALNSLKEKNNFEINFILNMSLSELFEEYLNSDKFKIDEINRLKKKNKSKAFIERYIYLSRHLIEFFRE